jgi:hypothetical protein
MMPKQVLNLKLRYEGLIKKMIRGVINRNIKDNRSPPPYLPQPTLLLDHDLVSILLNAASSFYNPLLSFPLD